MFRRLIVVLAMFGAISAANAQSTEAAPSASAPDSALRGESGLQWVVLEPSSADTAPAANDFVTIDYTGWNASGDVFDSTAKHPALRIFELSKLFPGLRDAVSTMKVGEKRRVWIPATLAPKGQPVVMDVRLLDVTNPVKAPADVAAPPAAAEKSKSGLAWVVLNPPSGTGHPKKNGSVTVNYTGWTTDGQMFDTSVITGQAASFSLDQVIPGWREGLQLMSPGEKRRFWIPEKAAYHGQAGMPKGMLVFDVELVKYR